MHEPRHDRRLIFSKAAMLKPMVKISYITIFLFVMYTVSPAHATQQNPLKFGVFPYISPAKLVDFYAPLKNLFSETLGIPVTMISARDFPRFNTNVHQGEYDVILTAPHFARLAEVESGFQRIVRTQRNVQGVYLVHRNSGISSLQQLQQKRIMIAQRSSLLFQMSVQQLKDHGLVEGRTITVLETGSHNNAMWAPLRGEADAAVTGVRLFDRLSHEQKDELQEIARTPALPGLMLMAHPRVPADHVASLRQAMLDFRGSDNGQRYFTRTGSKGFALISDEVMIGLDRYIDTAIAGD